MKVVITSATEKEVLKIKEVIEGKVFNPSNGFHVLFHTSGVGLLSACYSISKLIFEQKPDLIIQAGIAGTFDEKMSLGTVVLIKEEMLADTGVEECGTFKDIFDLGLESKASFPFDNGNLVNRNLKKLNLLQLPEVAAITINEITTRPQRIEQIKSKYRPVVESMEGAALHYCGLQTATLFIQFRSISNYIGERDKSKWNFKKSLDNLATSVVEYLDQLYINNKILE